MKLKFENAFELVSEVDILITKKGELLLSKIALKFPVFEAKFKTLSEEEIEELNKLLDKLRG